MDANGELLPAELALLRAHPQRTDLYLAIPGYTAIFTAEVDAPTPADNDGVYQVTFTGGSGAAWADVESGMTLLIGNGFGASDVGFARIRQDGITGDTITTGDGGITGTIYIGTTSEIDFTVGQNLTITNEFGLWPRHPYVDPTPGPTYGEEYMDWNIDHVEQHVYFAPVPVMFPSAVAELPAGGTVTVTFDGVESWFPSTAPAKTYAWTCAGADSVIPNNDTPTVITFSAAATYLVKLEVTGLYGGGHNVASIGYRYVIVYDDAHPLIKAPVLESCEGDFDTGGWSYHVTCHSQADLTTIHNRTLCILVAKDWYTDPATGLLTEQSIGPIVDRKNIVCIGYVDGESITWSNDLGNVSFDVQGPHWWLDKMQGYPTGVDDSLVDSIAWTLIENLTARKGLWHFLYWRTTAAAIMDIPSVARHGYALPDTRRLATTYTPAGSLWEQLRAIADRIFARATCDRYGRLFINVDMQLVDSAGGLRGTHPNIFGAAGFTDADWRDEITIERQTIPPVCLVDLSGVYWSGDIATSNALFALSPGHYYQHYGRSEKRDQIALTILQADANLLAGLYLGWLNNEYPNIDMPLSANLRAFDIAPYMFSFMSIAAADTPRGIEWTDKRLIPRRVSFQRDAGEAVMLTDVTFEAETFADAAMIGDPPITPPPPAPPPEPPVLCTDPLAINFGAPAPCIYLPVTQVVVTHNHKHVLLCTNFFTVASPAVWSEITPAGIETVCSLAIDPDGAGAWLVTRGTDKDANGVFRTDDISVGTWTLVLSQQTAETTGIAKKVTLGIYGSPPGFGEVRSIISMGNGAACVPEVTWTSGPDTTPTAVFVTSNSGGSWTISVPFYNNGEYPWNRAFWCDQYNELGCHQIDWDGSTLTIAGGSYEGGVYTWCGALATSSDGITWVVTPTPGSIHAWRSTNVIGSDVYSRYEDGNHVYVFPATVFSDEGSYSMGFRRTVFSASLVEIRHILGSAVWVNTELYIGNVLVLTSGGIIATVSVAGGGGGYSMNDVLTLATPDGGTSATVTVSGEVGGVVTAVTLTTPGTNYGLGVKATTGGGGAGCTIDVLTLTDYIIPFGIARAVAAGEYILAAKNIVVAGQVVCYSVTGVLYDRTGNLLAEIGMDWEGMESSRDSSGIESFSV